MFSCFHIEGMLFYINVASVSFVLVIHFSSNMFIDIYCCYFNEMVTDAL